MFYIVVCDEDSEEIMVICKDRPNIQGQADKYGMAVYVIEGESIGLAYPEHGVDMESKNGSRREKE